MGSWHTENLETEQCSARDDQARAYAAAIRYLARREHAYAELAQKLMEHHGVEQPLVATVLTELVQQDYLSDERFAQAYTRARMHKGFGPDRIRLELQQKGVAVDCIRAALAQAEQDGCDWSEKLETTWRKKFGDAPGDLREKARQMRFLRYRGFTDQQVQGLFETLAAD